MQGERAIGPLRRVFGGARNLDRGERDAAGALAGDLVVAEHRPAAIALREHAELVALVHFEHVRLEQRVVHAAGEAHAVVGEHVGVEFHVLADLAAVGALEPGLEQAERGVDRELRRCAGVVVRERQVDRLVTEGEGEADQARGQRIFAGGDGVDADELDAPRSSAARP